jgi:SAM-dependent methyltransferase
MAKIAPFEAHRNRYEQWFEDNRFAYEAEIEAVRLLLPKGGEGLEVGVGTGRFAVPLGISIGLEPSPAMAEIARAKSINVVEGVAETLPFSAEEFDFILMVTTICFLDDIDAAFKEAWRVLKPGGHVVIGFVDRESPLGQKYETARSENIFYREATFYSVPEVLAHLEKAGFGEFAFAQTIFRDLSQIEGPEPVKEGYGEGSFVVIRAKKISH